MQLSYSINIPAVSYPGQLADLSPHAVLSALASVAIAYGVLVIRDSATGFDNIIGRLPTAAGDVTAGKVLGISLADQARAQDPSVTGPQYPVNAAVPCCGKGRVWVKVENAVAKGGAVYARFSASLNTPALTQLGAFRADDDASAGPIPSAVLVPNARYENDALAGGYAVVSINNY
jgi:hypothetical protein